MRECFTQYQAEDPTADLTRHHVIIQTLYHIAGIFRGDVIFAVEWDL